MRLFSTVLAALVAVCVFSACGGGSDSADSPEAADNPYASYAGDWITEVYGPDGGDPLVVTMLKATDSDEGWSMKFNHLDEAIAATNVFLKDDSVVFQIGSYPSALREGQTVVSVTSYLHAHGDAMSGRFVAEYDNGDVLRGTMSSARAPR